MTIAQGGLVGAAYRSPFFVAASVRGAVLLEVRRSYVVGGINAEKEEVVRRRVGRLVCDYPSELVVFEPSLPLRGRGIEGWQYNGHIALLNLTVAEAKEELLGEGIHTNQDLFRWLLSRYPPLLHLVRRVGGTDTVAAERWRIVVLHSVALALAGERIARRQGLGFHH